MGERYLDLIDPIKLVELGAGLAVAGVIAKAIIEKYYSVRASRENPNPGG